MLPLFKEPGWAAPSGSSPNFLLISLGFIAAEKTLEFYLNFRQRQYLVKDELPQELTEQVSAVDDAQQLKSDMSPVVQTMDREATDDTDENDKGFLGKLRAKFVRSQAYNLDKNTWSFGFGLYKLGLTVAQLTLGFEPFLWTKAAGVALALGGWTSEVAISVAYIGISALINLVLELPVDVISTFVVEAAHGFNQTSVYTFVTDKVKGFFVQLCITVPIVYGIIELVHWGGPHFWFYVWVFLVVVMLVMVTLIPVLIMPLFNKFEPLPEGELRSEINDLAESLKFPLTKLEMVDGSKRSSHSNAFLYGFFNSKKIVLFDTLLDNPKEPGLNCTNAEIVSILAHELGHWKLSHTLKSFGMQISVYLVVLRTFAFFQHNPQMFRSFGFASEPVVIGLSLFGVVLTPLWSVIKFGSNALTRRFEYEADEFAVKLGKASLLQSALLKITLANLSSFEVDPLYHAFHHSHPTLLQRLRFMQACDKKDK